MWRADVATDNKSNRDRDLDPQLHLSSVEGKTRIELDPSIAALRLVLRTG